MAIKKVYWRSMSTGKFSVTHLFDSTAAEINSYGQRAALCGKQFSLYDNMCRYEGFDFTAENLMLVSCKSCARTIKAQAA